ncbi:hypothetical protein [Streptomyces sp. NPDC046870]|uniref:hypothetical protein n=1 Tax=Streptomyces sp. NPDC046870 TaxID=3155135 RepID=UPI0034514952
MHGIPAQARGESAAARHMAVRCSTDEARTAHPVASVRTGTDGGEQARHLADAAGPGHMTRTLAERGERRTGKVPRSARQAPGEPAGGLGEAGR